MFVNEYVKQHATIIPDHFDDTHIVMKDEEKDSTVLPKIHIQIEAFSGNFAMPCYGHSRPSTNCLNSNLMVQKFVVRG
jgi:hypothetical protein